uniref:Putative secreted protein n=1 Tax=Anopheles aquasalis TaxID=42839 RepID=T1E835_ANOAQ
MKLLLVLGVAVAFLGQLHAGPVVHDHSLVQISSTRNELFKEFDQLLNGIAKEAIDSLSSVKQNTEKQVASVETAIQELETLYNDKVLKEISKYDGLLQDLETQVSPCFGPVPEDVKKIVQGARGEAGVCAKNTVARVRVIQKNVEAHIHFGLGKVQDIVAIGRQCIVDNKGVLEQINCALESAPKAVSIVEEIIRDAATLFAETSQEVAVISVDTEQCLAVAVQDAVGRLNEALKKVAECLGDE